MPEVEIVLVEPPLYEGNIGFAARVMKNFGFTRLVLINHLRWELRQYPVHPMQRTCWNQPSLQSRWTR